MNLRVEIMMPSSFLKMEAELRNAAVDRLIAASLSDGKPAREATLDRWRAIGTQQSLPEVELRAPKQPG
ncbi:MAG: hypothetical protein B7Z81_11395 [Acidocella sp. 20-61-6]|nr:MAG: hypothetical protein B7Z81_11395 [Acidocella sp. 20-61-6]